MTDDDDGGWIGLMVGRDPVAGSPLHRTATPTPVVQTFASYNQARYFDEADAQIPVESAMPRLFPVVDWFAPDGDLNTREGAFAMMERMGINVHTGTTRTKTHAVHTVFCFGTLVRRMLLWC